MPLTYRIQDKHPGQPLCSGCAAAFQCPVALLDDPWLTQAQRITSQRMVRKGQLLLDRDAPATQLRFIKTGLALASPVGLDGVNRSIAVLGQGHLLGQVGLAGHCSALTYTALTDVAVCDLGYEDLKGAGLLTPRFVQGMVTYNVRAFTAVAGWSHIMRMPGLSSRLSAALILLSREQGGASRIQLPSQSVLAELLGVTRESISRVMQELEQLGAVTRLGRTQADLQFMALQALVVTG